METANNKSNKNLNQKEEPIMKTSKSLNQLLLTIVVVLFSIVAFGQDTGNSENTFTIKKFITVRGDVNKSNPVEGLTLDQINTGNGNQIETNYAIKRILDVEDQKSIDFPRERQRPVNHGKLSSRNLHNYPNPFVVQTTLEYEVDRPEYVHLAIYKEGRMVKILSSDFQNASNYRVVFDASGLAPGAYTAVLTVGDKVESHTMYKVAIREH